jgi:hypothetical protein
MNSAAAGSVQDSALQSAAAIKEKGTEASTVLFSVLKVM